MDEDVGMMIEARAVMYDEARNRLLDVTTSSMTSSITPVGQSIEIATRAALDCLITLWNQKGRERERSLRQPETMSELAAWIKAGSYQWSAIEIVLERRF